jgi:transposase
MIHFRGTKGRTRYAQPGPVTNVHPPCGYEPEIETDRGVPRFLYGQNLSLTRSSLSGCFLAALAVMARIRNVYADKGHDAERHRQLCCACQVKPFSHKRGRPHGSGLGRYRWPVERTLSWLLESKRLGLRYDRCGFIIQSLL